MKQYPRPITDAFLKEIELGKRPDGPDEDTLASEGQAQGNIPRKTDEIVLKQTGDILDQNDTSDVPIRFSEKKRLHWTGKTCEISSF